MSVEIRTVTSGQLPLFVRMFEVAALEGAGDAETAVLAEYLEPATNLGAWLGDRLVGTASHFDVELTVPGGASVPASAVTMISTLPTHTRRGISTKLMHHQLRQQREAGRIVAVLEASEGRIYGRWGYGPATRHLTVGMRVRELDFHVDLDDDGSFEFADDDSIVHFGNPLWDAERALRPGRLSRPPQWWAMTLADPPGWREGGGPLLAVFHVAADGTPDGYALYRITPRTEGHIPQAETKVYEVVSPDDHVKALLWRWLLALDLTGTVMVDGLADDDPLWWLPADLRQVRAISSREGLWLRLLDVQAALQARTWFQDGTLSLNVVDPVLDDQSGRYLVVARGGRATCERTGPLDDGDRSPADLTLGVDALAALQLGGVDARTLAGAGRVRARSGDVLAMAARMFRGDVAPHHAGGF